jgi:aspartyl-tRNA(Asn)/glutamyl-tRNA(Gln) amidotransferase subunit A
MTNDEGPLTIGDAAKRIRSGELTPSSLLEICLARIDRYEPKVKAWVYLDRERSRREAEQLTKELKEGLDRGPLHGIPIGVKDIIDVYDMPTGCGSKLWANSYARRDATCVERLRQAGALILGKTVTTAYAYLDPPVTRNPWNLERTPGGSSSGSAAAVACGMCLGALGTQTGGSVIRPAAYCGVCALKPTYDRVSVEGVLPLAPSLDHVGMMANCVEDLKHLYRVVASYMDYPKYGGIDVRDPLEVGIGWRRPLQKRIINTHVFQVTSDVFPGICSEKVRATFGIFLGEANDSDYAKFLPLVLPPGFNDVPRKHLALMAAEAAAVHRDRISRHPEDYPPKITELIEQGLNGPGVNTVEARDLRFRVSFELRQRDIPTALLMPATTGPAPTPETTGNPAMNSPWSFLGLPVATVPFARTDDGLPIGLQLVGEAFTEDNILDRAALLESRIGLSRQLPAMLPA